MTTTNDQSYRLSQRVRKKKKEEGRSLRWIILDFAQHRDLSTCQKQNETSRGKI